MNDRSKKILLGLGYSAWFSLLFVGLTLLTFPWSRVRDNITVVAANSGMAVTMDSLGPAWVGGKAKNLSVGKLSPNEASAPWVTFERLKAKTGLFSVLRTGRALGRAADGQATGEFVQLLVTALGSASVDAEMYGGELVLGLGQAGDNAAQFNMNVRDVNLSTFEVSSPKFSMNPRGTVRGKSDVTWDWKDPKKSSGDIDITIDDLIVSGLKAGAFGLPEMTFIRSEAHLKIGRGKAEFNDTVFEADEVQAVVEGSITLQESLMRSRLALKLRFKLRDDLDGLAKVAFGSNPKHKDDDGWYHYQINGTLGRYRFREAAGAASSSARGKGKRRKPIPRSRTYDDEEDEDTGDAKVSRRTNPPGSERVQRKKLHEMDDAAEIEVERERLREEREKRREERKARREELLAKRRERQERLSAERENGTGGERVQPDDADFVRTNNPEEEVIDEEVIEEHEEEVIEEHEEEVIEEHEEEFIEEPGPEEEFIPEGDFPEGDFPEGGGDGEYIEE